MSASVLSVSVISSVSFGAYKNFLCTICKLRYGAAEAKPSKLDVSLAGGAAGAARVGKQPKGKGQQEILFINTGGWKCSECFLAGEPATSPVGLFSLGGCHTLPTPPPSLGGSILV